MGQPPGIERDACGIGLLARPGGPADHRLLAMALQALDRLSHRGATADDGRTGDGAGVLTRLPARLFRRFLEAQGLRPPSRLAVGMAFLPAEPSARAAAQTLLTAAFVEEGFHLLAWRPVPLRPEVLGPRARATCPAIQQAVLADERGDTPEGIDRRLYRARRRAEKAARAQGLSLYLASASARTIVYKALALARDLAAFYPDLADPDFETDFVIFHQRFSTNTLPSWTRAQPFRTLCHNGEINTLQGNINSMRAREATLASPVWGETIADLRPIIDPEGSDSAMLDNVVEFLVRSGYDIRHALRMLIPEAWEHTPDLDEAARGFYAYHQGLMEPWDGPAAVLFADGRFVGALLDRNGLRPLRVLRTIDGLLYCGSEIGALEVPPDSILRLDRLGPGQMLAVDLETGRVQDHAALLAEWSAQRPYAEWVQRHRVRLPEGRAALEQAEGIYRRLLALRPDHATARAVLTYLQAQLGRPEEAQGTWAQLQAQIGSRADAWQAVGDFFLSHADCALDRDQAKALYQEADRAYAQALALNPRHLTAALRQGYALRNLGDLEGAVAIFRQGAQAAAEDPNAWVFYRELAITLAMLGRKGEAEAAAQQAWQRAPAAEQPGLRSLFAQMGLSIRP